MRAVYLPSLEIQGTAQLEGETHHHLKNVLRIEIGEEILGLNGLGLSQKMRVSEITKKSITLTPLSYYHTEKKWELDLYLYVPKKDALELCLKQAVEIGFSKITLIQGDFSQQKMLEEDRVMRLLISALEQSNNPYLPSLEFSPRSLNFDSYEAIYFFDSTAEKQGRIAQTKCSKVAMVIGPEAGFSEREIEFYRSLPKASALRLPIPILRTPTAVSVGAGILLHSLVDL